MVNFDNNTYGATLIGMLVAATLLGISCVQTLYYFTNQNDTWHTKSTVITLIILNTFHQALITHTVYTYLVTDWGNPIRIQEIVWSGLVQTLITGIVAVIVQSFLTLRMWRLSGHNILLTAISVVLIIGGFVILIIYVAKAFKPMTFAGLVPIKGESIAVNALGAATDILIAISLCILLNKSLTGLRKSDDLIKKLIVITVNTGLITSLCAICSLISILAAPNTFIYIAFYFCLAPLYTNCLLATLNARRVVKPLFSRPESMWESMSVSLRDFEPQSSPKDQRQNACMVRIDTTKGYPGKTDPDDGSGSVEEPGPA